MSFPWTDLILLGVSLLLGFAANTALAVQLARRADSPSSFTLRVFPVLVTLALTGTAVFGVRLFTDLVEFPGELYVGLLLAAVVSAALIQLWARNLGLHDGDGDWLRKALIPPAVIVWPLWLLVRLLTWPLLRLSGRRLCVDDPFLVRLDSASVETESDEVMLQAREMARQLADFPEKTVKEVMVPRIDVFCLDNETSIKEIIDEVGRRGYSRVPVYHETIDNIRGVLYVKELLQLDDPQSERVLDEEFLHDPIFVPETKLIGNLLREFQSSRTQMAVVVDEYGGTAGIVTLEDILEEIVGEIEDEFDEEQEMIQALDDGGWMIDARYDIGELNEELKIELPDEDYESLGGFIIAQLGHIPKPGEVIVADGLRLEVVQATPRRVGLVRLVSVPAADTAGDADEEA